MHTKSFRFIRLYSPMSWVVSCLSLAHKRSPSRANQSQASWYLSCHVDTSQLPTGKTVDKELKYYPYDYERG